MDAKQKELYNSPIDTNALNDVQTLIEGSKVVVGMSQVIDNSGMVILSASALLNTAIEQLQPHNNDELNACLAISRVSLIVSEIIKQSKNEHGVAAKAVHENYVLISTMLTPEFLKARARLQALMIDLGDRYPEDFAQDEDTATNG
ncbi:hypothetical protein [Vibrio phage vB_VhaS-a]|nr:hypothetical protein [Vibrio phage vB_VhaS-a]